MKLPDITYGTAARPQTISPGQAAAPHLAKARAIGQVAEMAGNIYEMKQEHDARESLALYGDSMSQFRMDMEERTDPFTQEELEDHGIADQVEVGEGGTAEAWRVYAPLLAAKQEEFKEVYGSRIKSAKYREAWGQQIDAANSKELEGAVQKAANMAIAGITNDAMAKADAAIDAGMFGVARAQYDLPIWNSTPERKLAKANALSEIDIAEEEWGLSRMLRSTDPEEINDAVEYFSSGKFAEESKLTPAKQLSYFNAATNRRSQLIAANEKAEKEAEDYSTMEALAGIETGAITSAEILANRRDFGLQNFKFLVGQADVSASGKVFKTDPLTKANFAMSIFQLESGNYSGPWEENIDALEQGLMNEAVIVDPITGEQRVNIAASDISSMRKDIMSLREAPYKTPEYVALAKEVSGRIRGGSASMVQIGPVAPEMANAYADAILSLRNYVNENGGTKADLSVWRSESLPYFVEEYARASMLQLPESTRKLVVWNEDKSIDIAGTRAEMSNDLVNARTEASKKDIRRDIAALDEWVKRYGGVK